MSDDKVIEFVKKQPEDDQGIFDTEDGVMVLARDSFDTLLQDQNIPTTKNAKGWYLDSGAALAFSIFLKGVIEGYDTGYLDGFDDGGNNV